MHTGLGNVAPGAPLGRVVIAMTDIQGSSALWEAAPEAMRHALALHDAVLRQTLRAHGGYEVKTEGDAFMCTFARAEDALDWAVAAQLELNRADWTEALLAAPEAAPVGPRHAEVLRGLRVRIGLHVGEPLCRPDPLSGRMDYFGPVVNRASRICGAGHGGQVLLSAALRAELGPAPIQGRLVDLGEHALRGLRDPERLWQLDAAALPPRTFPPPRVERAARPTPPAPLGVLLGREAELAGVSAALPRLPGRVLSLVGPAGVGKSRFVHEVAWQERDRWVGGVIWVPLANQPDPGAILQAVSAALGGTSGAGWAGLGARGPTLVVLDDLDGILAAARPQAEALLAAAPSLVLLTTSRADPGIAGAERVALAPLATPAEGAPASEVARSPAVALLLQRARDVGAAVSISADNAEELGALVRALDGLPLALELAATRLRVLSCETLLRRLVREGRGVDPAVLDDPRRGHSTLSAALELSWEGLRPWEQAALAQLAIFEGAFDQEAAEAVLALPTEAPPVAQVLAALVHHSLLVQGGDATYRMLRTLRGFALPRLVDPAAAELRHGQHLARLGTPEVIYGLAGADGAARLSRLVARRDDLLAAASRAAARGDAATLVATSVVAAEVSCIAGWLEAVVAIVDAALPHAADPWARGMLLYSRGSALRFQGDLSEAERALVAALEPAATDPVLSAMILARHANCRRLAGDPAGAAADLERALRLDPGPVWRIRLELTRVSTLQEQGQPMVDALERLLAEARLLREPSLIASVANNLGVAHLSRQRYALARRAFELAVEMSALAGPIAFAYVPMGNLGLIARAQGERERARAWLDRAVAEATDVGDRSASAINRAYLALVELDDGHPELAREALLEALHLAEQGGFLRFQGNVCGQLGLCALDLGDRLGARTWLSQAVEIHRRTQNTRWWLWSLSVLIHLAMDEGDVATAAAWLAEAPQDGPSTPAARAPLAAARARLLAAQGAAEALSLARVAVGQLSDERGDVADLVLALIALAEVQRRLEPDAAPATVDTAVTLLQQRSLRRASLLEAVGRLQG